MSRWPEICPWRSRVHLQVDTWALHWQLKGAELQHHCQGEQKEPWIVCCFVACIQNLEPLPESGLSYLKIFYCNLLPVLKISMWLLIVKECDDPYPVSCRRIQTIGYYFWQVTHVDLKQIWDFYLANPDDKFSMLLELFQGWD